MITQYHIIKDGYVIGSGESHEDHLDKVVTYGGELVVGEAPADLPLPPEPVKTYAQLRRSEYPSSSDFADAMYWRDRGDDTKWAQYLAKCDEVKRKYPKSQ